MMVAVKKCVARNDGSIKKVQKNDASKKMPPPFQRYEYR